MDESGWTYLRCYIHLWSQKSSLILDFVTLFHLICGRRSCAGQILSQNSWGLYCKVSEVIAGKDSTWGCWWCPHCKHRHCSQRQNSWRPHSRTWLKNHIKAFCCKSYFAECSPIWSTNLKKNKCSAAKVQFSNFHQPEFPSCKLWNCNKTSNHSNAIDCSETLL